MTVIKTRLGNEAKASDVSFPPQTTISATNVEDAIVEVASETAPTDADYLVKTANGSLSAERVVTDTATVTWDWSTAGQAKANIASGDLTKVDDTNVTLTLGGTPTGALLTAVSITVEWSGVLAVGRGGTGLASGTSGGILGYTAAGTLASSAALGQYGIVIGGGAGATPTAITAGTNGQLLLGVTGAAPAMATMSGGATISNSGVVTLAAATTTSSGAVELATDAETQTGSDTARAITPANLTAAAVKQGKHTIWIPAAAMTRRITNGAAHGLAETSSNKNMIKTLDFDASTQEFAQFEVFFPKSWNLSTVTFQPLWSHPSTTTNFGVVWGLAGVARSDDDPLDVAFGTAQTSTDTGGTTDDCYVGPESSAITIAGTPAAGDTVQFQINRTVSDGSDTMAVDARLHGIRLFYTTNAATDA